MGNLFQCCCGKLPASRYIYRKGVADHVRGELEAAIVSYSKALELAQSEDSELHHSINDATSYGTLTDSKPLLSVNRKHILAILYDRACAYRALGKKSEATTDLDTALQLCPDHDLCSFLSGVMRAEAGEHSEAVKDFTRSINANDTFASAFISRAASFYQLKMYDASVKDYEHALQLFPQFQHGERLLGLAQLRAGKPAVALQTFNDAIAKNPTDALLFFNRAMALGELGRDIEAIASYETTLLLYPSLDVRRVCRQQLALLRSQHPATRVAYMRGEGDEYMSATRF
eukprot:TRINITY_DN2668_c0_g1_i1.p1 TRINITY_DN2668_c0_g1~~TRINITY_DN2668_c0_g1_i1.p1  ORF type:complete len:288 (+),score=41.53 TRINITY_DN2668_c0_g1_i1:49-912(+)